jgi:HEPN domain-containing protein
MNDLVIEWIDKAESDYRTAEREARVRRGPSYDGACFHAQQCAEKYLKALLILHQIPFRPIHDLEVLLELALPINSDLQLIRDPLLLLNDYAVDIRYPGESATKEEAEDAVRAMRIVRDQIRQQIGAPGSKS